MASTKTMLLGILLGILLLLFGLGVITTTVPQATGMPVSFLFGGLSSTTLRIIDASGYALILLGLLVGLVGSFRKDRGPAVEWSRTLR